MYLQASWLFNRVKKKKISLHDFGEKMRRGKIRTSIVGELCGIIDEPMFLPNPKQNLH